jgi:hypothetical protein
MKGKVNCWEFMGCKEDKTKKCPAFIKNAGKVCWLVAGAMGNDKPRCVFFEELGDCTKCDFYRYMDT